MSNMKVEKLYFDREDFVRALRRSAFICPNTFAELSRKSQVSEATIYKALKDGYLSRRTYDRLEPYIKFKVDSRK